MTASIILIGPSNAGKTTLSTLLADAMNYSAAALDDLRWSYYAEIGYDAAKAKEIRRQGGMQALANHWKPFDIHAVERVLKDYPSDHVIAFGAGHSIYDDEAQYQRAKAALAPFPHVILLLPSPDVEESYRILWQRLRESEPDMPRDMVDGLMAVNRRFIDHPSNLSLATVTLYTAGKTPAESCAEIVRCINP